MLLSPTSPTGTRSLAFLSLMLGVAFFCDAAPISYNVNQTIGPGGVTGQIVTDGMIGVLAQTNILGVNLLLNDGMSTFNLSRVDFFPFSGSDLSATMTQLLFNFSGTDGGIFDLSDASLDFNVCFSTVTAICWSNGGGGETLFLSSPFSGTFDNLFTHRSGMQVIGTAGATSIPEPSTPALVGVAIVLLAFQRKIIGLRRGVR